jgi:hypothetical protein
MRQLIRDQGAGLFGKTVAGRSSVAEESRTNGDLNLNGEHQSSKAPHHLPMHRAWFGSRNDDAKRAS